jgi:hypothetical protein
MITEDDLVGARGGSGAKGFNLINYAQSKKGADKVLYDPQMLATKLKRLENKAEITRI